MGISFWQLLIVLVIVVLLFGTKRLRNLGGDLGSAVKGFKSAVKDGSDADKPEEEGDPAQLQQATEEAGVEAEGASKERDRA